jgi:hypothetical protein
MFAVFSFLSLCVMLLAVPAFGANAAELPPIVEDVVRNRDFFANPWALWGYEDCILLDVKRFDEKHLGLDFIAPFGLEYRAVYEVETLKVTYSDAFVPEKSRREAMMRAGISVKDAMKLAKSALEAETRLKEKDAPVEVPEKAPEKKAAKKGKAAIRKRLKTTK